MRKGDRPFYLRSIGLMVAVLAIMLLGATACGGGPSDADVAAENLSVAAEQFEVPRKIVFINGITGDYLYEIQGYCSIDMAGAGLRALAVTCKVGEKDGRAVVKKSYLGLSDNVTWMVEQVDGVGVSTNHYRVIFKPEAIVPDFDRP